MVSEYGKEFLIQPCRVVRPNRADLAERSVGPWAASRLLCGVGERVNRWRLIKPAPFGAEPLSTGLAHASLPSLGDVASIAPGLK